MRGPGARGRVREVGGRAGNPAGSLLGRRAFPWELEVSSRGVVSSGPQEDGWLWGGGFEGVSSGQERSCGLVGGGWQAGMEGGETLESCGRGGGGEAPVSLAFWMVLSSVR